jgi:non-ribosomal peptide synthetase component F
MAIEMVGAVYCPLSPHDPQHRLHALVQQTQSRFVLVHWLTKTKFYNSIDLLDVDSVLTGENAQSDVDVNGLPNDRVTPENIAYIIFTSGSTGTPKPVSKRTSILPQYFINFCCLQAQLRHRNFTQSIHSLLHVDILNKSDTIIQIARCSFDIHVQEIIGTLMIGATLVMLHPRGNIDLEYLSTIMQTKQITFFYTVPTLLQIFFDFISETKKVDAVKYLRSLCTGGKCIWTDFHRFLLGVFFIIFR